MYRNLIVTSLALGFGLLILGGCGSTEEISANYDQDFQVVSVNSPMLQSQEEKLAYSNEDLVIAYDLWQEGGKMNFVIQNKSDQIIYVDLKRTFFIKNGAAKDYYINKKRTFSEKTGQSSKEYYTTFGLDQVSYSESSSEAVQIANKAKIAIPPKSFKSLSKFRLTSSIFEFCGLEDDFTDFDEKRSAKKTFERSSSPLVFENYLKYSFDKDLETAKTVRNVFWVSEVQNIQREDFYEREEVQAVCDSTETKEVTVTPYSAKFRFYNTYDDW